NASFWPFLIKSCVSMRSIKEFGPFPSKIGRYIGRLVAGEGDAKFSFCDEARSTIDNKAIKKNANARMGRYASGERRFFKRNLAGIYAAAANSPAAPILCRILCRRKQSMSAA